MERLKIKKNPSSHFYEKPNNFYDYLYRKYGKDTHEQKVQSSSDLYLSKGCKF
jgi:hypothetical protein